MKLNDYLRLILLFGENEARTFQTNLQRMVILVLMDYHRKGLSILSIQEILAEKFELQFSESEISEMISNQKKIKIIATEKGIYDIEPEVYISLIKKTNNNTFLLIVKRFMEKNEITVIDVKDLVDILYEFFYMVFNTNKSIILELLNHSYETIAADMEMTDFDNQKKELINSFLMWDNSEKNKYIYSIISCCFDYCIMTKRKSMVSYSSIFRNKTFFLDSNIIFRLMGLNKADRQKTITAFVNKCEEANISLRYTNFTKKEIYDTIDHYVDALKNLLGSKQPISSEAIQTFDSKFSNMDFYDEYFAWITKDTQRLGDYTNFTTYLKKKANSIMNRLNNYTFESYEKNNALDFTKYYDSLREYKSEKNKKAYNKSIKTDIENYMKVNQLNNGNLNSTVENINHYIITADHSFVDWAREIIPEAVPVVVLPSVWYSILLKYFGRTDDDFASFSKFLSYNFQDYKPVQDVKKMNILSRVLELDEPTEIKDEILYDIETQLKSDHLDLDNIDELVDSAHEYVIEKRLALKEEELIKKMSEGIVQWDKPNMKKAKNHYDQGIKGLIEGDTNSAIDETRMYLVKALVNDKFKRIYYSYWFTSGFICMLFIGTYIILAYNGVKKTAFFLTIKDSIPFITATITLLWAITGFVLFKFKFLSFNKEKIRAKLLEKEILKQDKALKKMNQT